MAVGKLGGWRGCGLPAGSPSYLFLTCPCVPFSSEAMHLGPCSGLLVDWLETLDPEVIGSCPDLQHRLLFSRAKVGCAPAPHGLAFRPFQRKCGLGPHQPGQLPRLLSLQHSDLVARAGGLG